MDTTKGQKIIKGEISQHLVPVITSIIMEYMAKIYKQPATEELVKEREIYNVKRKKIMWDIYDVWAPDLDCLCGFYPDRKQEENYFLFEYLGESETLYAYCEKCFESEILENKARIINHGKYKAGTLCTYIIKIKLKKLRQKYPRRSWPLSIFDTDGTCLTPHLQI